MGDVEATSNERSGGKVAGVFSDSIDITMVYRSRGRWRTWET